ncbi:hypothetical protein D3C72_349500 [compost metagenome]
MLRADELRRHVDGQRGAVRFASRIGQGVVEDLLRGDAGERYPGVHGVGVMPVRTDRERAVMSLNSDVSGAGGVRIKGGDHAVEAGDAQTGVDRVQLIHRPLRIRPVEDVAVDGVTAGGIELGEGVSGPHHVRGDGDLPHRQRAHFPGVGEGVGARIQIQPAEVNRGGTAQQ